MASGKGSGAPGSPKIGQLLYDYPTASMRRWNGKHWAEVSYDQLIEKGDDDDGDTDRD